MASAPLPGQLSRKRVAKGPRRPQYLESPDLDRVMMMLTALVGEVSTLRDRLDTHEALAESGTLATREAVEGFTLTADRQAIREARREAMVKRVYRVVMEEVDAIREDANDREIAKVLAEQSSTVTGNAA